LAQKQFRQFREPKLIPLGLPAPCRVNQMALHGASPSLARLVGGEVGFDWHSVIAHRAFLLHVSALFSSSAPGPRDYY